LKLVEVPGSNGDGECFRLNNWLTIFDDFGESRENLEYLVQQGNPSVTYEQVKFSVYFEPPLNANLTDEGFLRFEYGFMASGFEIKDPWPLTSFINYETNTVDFSIDNRWSDKNRINVYNMVIRLVKNKYIFGFGCQLLLSMKFCIYFFRLLTLVHRN
jgi:hypothetical protein